MNLRDPALLEALSEAKDACDERLSTWACGDLRLALDEHGCVTNVEGLNLSGDLEASYRDCLVAELSPSCSRCEQSVAGRVYYSCTVL